MTADMSDKPIFWLKGKITTPPFSQLARIKAGYLIRKLQQGENIGMPQSRPMPAIGARCHELRVQDADQNLRVVYRIDNDAIIVVEIFSKKSQKTPKNIIVLCKQRLSDYDRDS